MHSNIIDRVTILNKNGYHVNYNKLNLDKIIKLVLNCDYRRFTLKIFYIRKTCRFYDVL